MRKVQAAMPPQALGALLNSNSYGATIPKGTGLHLASLFGIWNDDIMRVGSQGGFLGIGGTPDWFMRVDFLLGHNPIVNGMQALVEGYLLPLGFAKSTQSLDYTSATYTIPDPHFYQVVAVTMTISPSGTFNDYGGPGVVAYSGAMELPLWNACIPGPDPTNSNNFRQWGAGATTYYNVAGSPVCFFPWLAEFSRGPITLNFYYAYKLTNPPAWPKGADSPLSLLHLTFEPELGDGPEFGGSRFSADRTLFDSYAGVGSPAYFLGTSDTQPSSMPNNQIEVLDDGAVYPSGDADFPDAIEGIIKSGPVSASPSNSEGYNTGGNHYGLNMCDFPGAVQKVQVYHTQSTVPTVRFALPNLAGNTLVVFTCGASGLGGPPTFTISDDAGNAWTLLFQGGTPSGGAGYGCWMCTAKAWPAGNNVYINNAAFHQQTVGLELVGLDTYDSVASKRIDWSGLFLETSVTTTNRRRCPSIIYEFTAIGHPLGTFIDDPRWKVDIPLGSVSFNGEGMQTYGPIRAPGTIPFKQQVTGVGSGSEDATSVFLVFKNSQMSQYPRALGNVIDDPTMQVLRAQCRAYNLIGSLYMNSQRPAKDWLQDLCDCSNAAPVRSGHRLKFIARSEASAAGNGVVFTAPTASGPVATLGPDDFVPGGSDPAVSAKQKSRFGTPASLSIQITNRAGGNYAPSEVSQPMSSHVSVFGTKKADPKNLPMIMDPTVGRAILGVMIRRQNHIDGREFPFATDRRWQLLEAMDLVTLEDPQFGFSQDVRITSRRRPRTGAISFNAEPFIYGVHVPIPISVDSTDQNQTSPFADPGNVNVPIFIEPVPALYNNQNQQELWIVVSGGKTTGTAYGGCVPYISTDGGSTYNPIGNAGGLNGTVISGTAITGVVTADFPFHADPDTVDSLMLDLTESNGVLQSFLAGDRDSFNYPCYLGYAAWAAATAFTLGQEIVDAAGHVQKVTTAGTSGGSAPTFNHTGGTTADGSGSLVWTDQGIPAIPYELATYGTATQTGTSLYTLPPEIRRAVFGTPASDHAQAGARFAFLTPGSNPPGILKLVLPPQLIGVQLWFKFAAYNTVPSLAQSTSGLTAYSFTPTGTVGSVNPNGLPPGLVTAN